MVVFRDPLSHTLHEIGDLVLIDTDRACELPPMVRGDRLRESLATDLHREGLIEVRVQRERHDVVHRCHGDAVWVEEHRVVLRVRVGVADDGVEDELRQEPAQEPPGGVRSGKDPRDLLGGHVVLVRGSHAERLRQVLGVTPAREQARTEITVEAFDDQRRLITDLEHSSSGRVDTGVEGEVEGARLRRLDAAQIGAARLQDVRRWDCAVRPEPGAVDPGESELPLRAGERETRSELPRRPRVGVELDVADPGGDVPVEDGAQLCAAGRQRLPFGREDEAAGDVAAGSGEEVEGPAARCPVGIGKSPSRGPMVGEQVLEEVRGCTLGGAPIARQGEGDRCGRRVRVVVERDRAVVGFGELACVAAIEPRLEAVAHVSTTSGRADASMFSAASTFRIRPGEGTLRARSICKTTSPSTPAIEANCCRLQP